MTHAALAAALVLVSGAALVIASLTARLVSHTIAQVTQMTEETP